MSEISHWRTKRRYYGLIGSKCEDCESEFFPPVYVCPKCGSRRIVDKEMPKRGRILVHTLLYSPLSGFEGQIPLILAFVELENGVRIFAQITDSKPDEVKDGDEVEMVFRRVRVLGKDGQILYGYKFKKVSP